MRVGESMRGRLSLTRLARAWSRPIVVAWLLLCAVLGFALSQARRPAASGDLDGLVPVEHRPARGDLLLLVRVDSTRLPPERSVEAAATAAAKSVGQRLGAERIPLAPPAAEVTSWMDAHALYLLPRERHAELAEALTDDALESAVDGLKARLGSPMFGVAGEQPRRDPLRLSRMAETTAPTVDPGAAGTRPTADGDLVSRRGDAVLVGVHSPRAPGAVMEEARQAVASQPVTVDLAGPSAASLPAREAIGASAWQLVVLTLAGLTAVLAIALRSVRAVLVIVACIASGIGVMLALQPSVDIWAVPMLVLLAGFGCEGALHLQRISTRGWPSLVVLGAALLPLLLSPYPVWNLWAWRWLVGVVVLALVLRLVLPAMVEIVGGAPAWDRRGFLLRPARPLAVLLSVGALASGAWATQHLAHRGLDRSPRATIEADRVLHEQFFDPRLVAVAETPGRDAADALARAASDVRALSGLVPSAAAQLEGPGTFVLEPGELEARREALAELKLGDRMFVLDGLLTARGFRADAFGEFLRGAGNLDDLPTASAALEGPLGPWISGFVRDGEDGAYVQTRVHLRPDSQEAKLPSVQDETGNTIVLRGPVVAARHDRGHFDDWVGVYLALQLWIGALAVWLGTRSLAVALGATLAALSAQTGVLACMVPLGLRLGPELLPALLLVGAAAMVAGGRACRAVELSRPFYATGLLVTGLCQVAAGLVLWSTGEAPWVRFGSVVAIGSAFASGAGLFVAPGIARLFRPDFGDSDGDSDSDGADESATAADGPGPDPGARADAGRGDEGVEDVEAAEDAEEDSTA